MTDLLRLELPPDRASARQARIEARRALAGRYPDDVVTDVLMVVSELVSNAAVHTEGGCTLVLRCAEGTLLIEAHDDNTRPHQRRSGDVDDIGRGLGVVQSLTNQWGIERQGAGKCVWAEIDLGVGTRGHASGGPGQCSLLPSGTAPR